MRMTDFPVLEEIKEEYIQLRQVGNSREDAVRKLVESYADELQDIEETPLLWIGLADAQYFRKELSEDVAKKAISALDAFESFGWDICPGDLNRRREHYEQAPMPERNVGKPGPKFRCQWRIGDTFAYQLTGKEAKELGIHGKYMLLRKVSEVEFGNGSLYPIVTVSFLGARAFPTSDEAFMDIPLLKLQEGGRMFSPIDKFEYRTVIVIKSRKKLAETPLQFVGNFMNVQMPTDEIIFTEAGVILMNHLELFETNFCLYWKRHNRIIADKKELICMNDSNTSS